MKRFQKRTENFVCGNCGEYVVGDGFTNHCPKCLWSKHVDKNPGDRMEKCGGLMEPIGVDQKRGEFVLIHKCLKCGTIKRNKVSPNDDREVLLKIGWTVPGSNR